MNLDFLQCVSGVFNISIRSALTRQMNIEGIQFLQCGSPPYNGSNKVQGTDNT